MATSSEYRQCTLRRVRSPSCFVETVSHIPAKFAHSRRTLKLKRPDGSWEEGWVVEHVGALVNEPELLDSHRAINQHRRATGDSLARQSQH